MKLLERISTGVSVVVILKDELRPDGKVIGDVFIKPKGVRKFICKENICCLMDLKDGEYKIIAGGKFYQENEYTFKTGSLLPGQPLFYISLKPKTEKVFIEGTILEGKIFDPDNKPVQGATIKIKGMKENAISGLDGSFSIIFKSLDSDKDITINIKKGIYIADLKVHLKKNITLELGPIKLTKK